MTDQGFRLIAFIWISSTTLIWCKVMIDQYRLLKLYRKRINHTYAVLFWEAPGVDYPEPKSNEDEYFKDLYRQIRIIFMKYPDHPDLRERAHAVKLGMILALVTGIGGFLLIGALVFLSGQ
jgi:hypothetical protein